MVGTLAYLGLGSWVPILVSLILVPGLYIYFAIEVHKEYAELLRAHKTAMVSRGLSSSDEDKKLNELMESIHDRIIMFELDWWLVGAFGILICAIMGCGYLVDGINASATVRVAMSVYATLIGLIVGFRFAWARLKLAQELKDHYARYL